MVRLYERPNSPYWYAEIEGPDGKSKRISTGVPRSAKTRLKAREAAEARRSELIQQACADKSLTLQQLWLFWVKTQTDVKPSSVKLYGVMISHIIHYLKNPLICEITPATIRAYMKDVRATGRYKDRHLRLQLSVLSSIMEWAIDHDVDGAPLANPVKLVNKRALKVPFQPPRWLKPEELRRLWDVLSDPEQCKAPLLKEIVVTLLDTGMRSEEVMGLEWREVDLEAGAIMLSPEREKTKRGRIIPITSTVQHTLEELKRYPDCPYVFVNPHTRTRYRNLRGTWHRVRRLAGVPHARIHDLRHTFATFLRHSGVAKEDRMSIVGHSSQEVHAGYATASLSVIKNTVEKYKPSTLLTHKPKE